MKQKIFTLLVVVVIGGIVGCSYSDTATVTIDLGIYKQAKLSLYDRVLAWIAFSTPVTADQLPVGFETLQINVNVTAPDMDTMSWEFGNNEVIANNGKITLTVPAGAQRTFEIVAMQDSNRFCGGITTVDLTPGEVSLTIEVGKLVRPYATWDYAENKVKIVYYKSNENNGPQPLYFKVYRDSSGAFSSQELFDTVAAPPLKYSDDDDKITYYYGNESITSDTFSGFSISAVNKYGEGDDVQIYQY